MKQILTKNIEKLKATCLSIVPQMDMLKESEWGKIQKRLQARYSVICNKNNLESYMLVDYIIGCVGGNKECLKFIEAFVNTLNEALKYADSLGLKNKVEGIMRQLFITGDIDVMSGNSDFKNRLNELLAFNWFASCDNYRLVNIEEPLSDNGKSIDFLLQSKATGDYLGIESMTIQGVNPEMQDDNQTLANFLDARIELKYADKMKNVPKSDLISNILIMPIVECQKGLEKFEVHVTNKHSTPIFTSCISEKEGKVTIELLNINSYLKMLND